MKFLPPPSKIVRVLSTSTIILFLLTSFQIQAQQQQLHCGLTPITFNNGTCMGPLGIGGPNVGVPLFNWTFGLYIEHDTNTGGGLFVNNPSTATGAFGIYSMSTNGNSIISWSNAGNAVNATSLSGDGILGNTTSGNAIHGISTFAGRAGFFEGNVTVNGNQYISGNLQSGSFTAEVATTQNISAASFKSGTNRQLFVVPNLGGSGFNYLSQAGDHGIFFSDGLGSGNQNQSAGLVIGPWKGGNTGIRISNDGKVGIGVAQPQHALDVDGEGLISLQLSVPKVIGEQNGSSPMSLCGNTGSADGACINLFGNGHPTSPGQLSLVASNGVTGGEIRFMQNTGPGTFVQNMVVTADGEVGIGVAAPEATLHVNGTFIIKSQTTGNNEFEVTETGTVHCRVVEVDAGTIPDYVFASDYNLLSLSELDDFIQKNHHLPGIPSEQAYKEKGRIDVGELQLKSLEKIEELTLYMIELEKKMKRMEKELEGLRK